MTPAWLDQSRDYPFESRFVDLDGNRVHYIDEGDGPTLLLLHANPLWSFYFRKVVRGLRATFRCVALDYPGYTGSPVPLPATAFAWMITRASSSSSSRPSA